MSAALANAERQAASRNRVLDSLDAEARGEWGESAVERLIAQDDGAYTQMLLMLACDRINAANPGFARKPPARVVALDPNKLKSGLR
jgi:hypothetical protein